MNKKFLILFSILFSFCFLFCGRFSQDEFDKDTDEYSVYFMLDNALYQKINSNGHNLLSLPVEPSKNGYEFVGWYKDNQKIEIGLSLTSDISVLAKFETINYQITYDLSGGKISSTNLSNYNIETETFVINNPTLTGYDFQGWSSNIFSGLQMKVSIEKGTIGNLNFVANWKIKEYSDNY